MTLGRVPRIGNKREELLARKQKILENIKYYEKRINEETTAAQSAVYFDDSSDEGDLLPFPKQHGPTLGELRKEEKMLSVCLDAVLELSSLEVLDSAVISLSEDPVIKGEAPVKKPGLWKQVTAECRIDPVPFSINFYVHQADAMFGAKSFRGLNVLVVKEADEAELSKSVLPQVKCPVLAHQVLGSYATEYRSRRTIIARLIAKYSPRLTVEPMAEGGCRLKCGNILELSWVLENKKSPLAAFHHKMKFDLDYIDESYLKIISQAHKQLSNPNIDTDERTLLLAQIINACIEAENVAQESMGSDTEPVKKIDKRRITLDNEEPPVAKKTKSDKPIRENLRHTTNNKNDQTTKSNEQTESQIMAPPKSLPKKGKPKGKENADQNKRPAKRLTVDENNSNAKKAKVDDGNNVNEGRRSVNKQNKTMNDSINSNKNKAEIVKTKDKSSKLQNVKTSAANVKENANKNLNDNENVTGQNSDHIIQTKNDQKIATAAEYVTKKGTSKVNDSNKNIDKVTSKNEETSKVTNKPESTNVQSKTKNLNKNLATDSAKNSKPADKISKIADKVVTTSKNVLENKQSQKLINKDNPKEKNKHQKETATSDKIKPPNKDAKINDKPAKNVETNTKPANKIVNSTKNIKDTQTNNQVPLVKVAKDTVKTVPKTKLPQSDENLNNKMSGKQKPGKEQQKTKVIQKTAVVQKAKNDQKKESKLTVVQKPKNGLSQEVQKAKTDKVTEVQKEKRDNSKETQKEKELNKKHKNNTLHFFPEDVVTSTPKQKKKKSIVAEKQVIASNVANKNKDHIGNIASAEKSKSAKVGKPKIQALSHKNPSLKKVPKIITGNIKNFKLAQKNNLKIGNSMDSTGSKVSKIPKRLSHSDPSKKNPLRISPRKLPSTFKTAPVFSVKHKLNHNTNIPRLMKKP